MSVNYKTLFETKLMHEFYLTRQDGSLVFEEAGQAGRLAFLQTESNEGRPSINADVKFEFPETLKSKYEGMYLKLLPTYSGCKVVIRVASVRLADKSTVYQPFVPLPADLKIFISIIRKNNNINSYTNERIKRSLASVYYFSNNNLITARAFPFLTNNIPAESSSTEYEQGELSRSSSNTIREFYRMGGADQWSDVKGTGFANESDRLLLPEKFEYSFSNSVALTQATFLLRDSNGNEVHNLTIENSAALGSKCLLDFSGKVNAISKNDSLLPSSSMYTLEVNTNNSPLKIHPVVFSDELLSFSPWGVIEIRTTGSDNSFNLFAPDGFLIRRKDPFGTVTPGPVFEIPVKSRLAYWRFVNNKGKELKISLPLTDYVNKEGNVLVTKKPRSLARHWFLLRRDPPPGTIYIPNPVNPDLRIEDDRRMFYNVNVAQSELFPFP